MAQALASEVLSSSHSYKLKIEYQIYKNYNLTLSQAKISKNILLVERRKKINFHRKEINLRTAFSSEMNATENNGVTSLKCQKKTTVYLEFCKLVKLSFKGEDGIRCFLKRKEEVFKHKLNFTN